MMKLKDLDKEHLLDALGLQEKTDNNFWVPVLGAALGGMVVGAAIALLVSPKSGPEMRGTLRNLVTRKKEELPMAKATPTPPDNGQRF